MKTRVWPLIAALGLLFATSAHAGEPAPSFPSPLTLRQSVDYALTHQPAISAQRALQQQAAANVEHSRAGYVQQLDASESILRSARPRSQSTCCDESECLHRHGASMAANRPNSPLNLC